MNEIGTPDAKRRGGRRERRDLRTTPDHAMLPTLTGKLPLTEPMDQEQIERIDAASLDILEEIGVVFRDDIALEDWRKAGADVRGERVHLAGRIADQDDTVRDQASCSQPRKDRRPWWATVHLHPDDRRALSSRPRGCSPRADSG